MTGTQAADETDVLLLERDEGLREPFRIWLSRRWSVAVASDAHEALELFSPSVGLVVTSDQLLLETPEGLLTAFADRGYANPILVLCSRMERPRVEGVEVHHLVKPVDRSDLVSAVEDALG